MVKLFKYAPLLIFFILINFSLAQGSKNYDKELRRLNAKIDRVRVLVDSLEFNDRFLSNHLASFEKHLSDNKSKNFNYLLISKLKNIGSEYRWYIDYQIAIHEGKENIKF